MQRGTFAGEPRTRDGIDVTHARAYACVVRAAGTAVIISALLVLLGWALGSAALRSIVPGVVPMAPLTALGFILSGAALLLLTEAPTNRSAAVLARAAAAAAAWIGVLTLIEYITGTDLWIDRLLFEQELRELAPRPVGRIAPNTALAFLLAGLALLALGGGRQRSAWLTHVPALLVALVAFQALIGYAYGVEALYGLARFTPMAANTAASFLVLSIGILCARPEGGFMATITRADLGGFAARRLIPAAVLILVLLGWLRVLGERAGLYGSAFGASLLVVGSVVLFVLLIWRTAAVLGRLDAERRAAEAERARLLERERRARGEAEASTREAERRAREEAALRRAAQAVTAAYSTEEVIRRIAETAVDATEADGALVLHLDRTGIELRVVAASGTRFIPLGERLPYRGSATELVLERRKPLTFDGAATGPVPTELERSCPRCSAALVPLEDAGQPIGSLLLLRRADRPPFRDDEVARTGTFANLASLALHKVHLLEDAERRRTELQELLESRSRLMRGFSHDLRNPLGAADGQLALLEEGVLGALAPEHRDGLVRARRSIRSALRLIDALVELARVEAGRIQIQQEPSDLRSIAREVAEEHRAAAAARNLAIRIELPESLALIRSDPDRIRQILGNLVSNAVKYTPHGYITVRAQQRDDAAPGPGRWIALDVADTGPGIPRDQQEAVFGEFTRLEPGTGRGAGLGLAISRRIARLLGGDVTLDSEIGRGSTFTLWLPLESGAERGLAP